MKSSSPRALLVRKNGIPTSDFRTVLTARPNSQLDVRIPALEALYEMISNSTLDR